MSDAAEWASAIGTWLAFGAAGIAGWQAWRVLEVERDRDDRAEREREAVQASLVAAWPEHTVTGLSGKGTSQLVVGNRSEQPIYRVTARYSMGTLTGEASAPVIPPESVKSWPLELKDALPRLHTIEQLEGVAVSITFRDAANRRWLRQPDGTLMDLTGHGEPRRGRRRRRIGNLWDRWVRPSTKSPADDDGA